MNRGGWVVLATIAMAAFAPAEAHAAIVNPGFEAGFEGWTEAEPDGAQVSVSGEALEGAQSAKLSGQGAFVSQVVAVEPGAQYRLAAQLRGPGNLGVKVGPQLFFEQHATRRSAWEEVAVTFESGDQPGVIVFASSGGPEFRVDNFVLERIDAAAGATSASLITRSAGGTGLSPDLPPGRNFDLLGWKVQTPDDPDGDGIGGGFSEQELASGAEDPRFFFTGEDGGMVFRATVAGGRTSTNTRFTRSELREMLRRGDTSIRTHTGSGTPNENNWVFSSAPESARQRAGAVDGTLRATLAVNRVTTTGADSEVGRVIVGQIHAWRDEPIRLYYRKLPQNQRGVIYAAHEPNGEDDIYVELVGGSRGNSASDPADGIALDEVFSYTIQVIGNSLLVEIRQGEEVRGRHTFDMNESGYDIADEYMYFKAGAYNQNATGDPDDFTQVTFYALEAVHP